MARNFTLRISLLLLVFVFIVTATCVAEDSSVGSAWSAKEIFLIFLGVFAIPGFTFGLVKKVVNDHRVDIASVLKLLREDIETIRCKQTDLREKLPTEYVRVSDFAKLEKKIDRVFNRIDNLRESLILSGIIKTKVVSNEDNPES
jgi:hypothetical protein